MRHPDEGEIHAWLDGALAADDAARIDGCGHLRIYSRIIVPLSVPALVTSALSVLASQMQWVGIGWYLYDLTGDPMTLAWAGVAAFVPIALVSWPVAQANFAMSRGGFIH